MNTTVRCVSAICLLILCIGCAKESGDSPTASLPKTTPVAFNSAGAPTVEFTVPDMMCPDGCGAKVKEILSQQPGAKDVLVDFPNKTAIVAVEKDKFDAEQARAALVDHQFKQSAVKDAAANNATAIQ